MAQKAKNGSKQRVRGRNKAKVEAYGEEMIEKTVKRSATAVGSTFQLPGRDAA